MAKGTINESIYKPQFVGTGFVVNGKDYSWSDFDQSILDRMRDHGLTQKLGDSYSSVGSEIPDDLSDDEKAEMRARLCAERVDETLSKLLAGDWTVRDVGPRLVGADRIAFDMAARVITERVAELNKGRAKKDKFEVPTGKDLRERVAELLEADPSITEEAQATFEKQESRKAQLDAILAKAKEPAKAKPKAKKKAA